MQSSRLKMKSVAMRPKPRVVAMKLRTVQALITFHKRRIRHAAKQYLKTRSRRDWDRASGIMDHWDFD